MPEATNSTGTNTNPAAADTSNVSVQNPPANDGSSNGQSRENTSVNQQTPPNVDPNVQRREEGKLQQVQRELKEAQEALKASKQVEQTFQKYAMANENNLRNVLEANGYEKSDIDEYVTSLKQKNPKLWGSTQEQEKQPSQVNHDQIAEIVSNLPEVQYARTLKQEKDAAEFGKFFEAFPEYDPKKVAPDKLQEVGTFVANNVSMLANTFMTLNPKLSVGEAMIDAANWLTGKTRDEVQKAKEQGKLEGALATSANGNAIGNPAKGTSSTKPGSYALTDTEMNFAKMAGMTPEEYAKYKLKP